MKITLILIAISGFCKATEEEKAVSNNSLFLQLSVAAQKQHEYRTMHMQGTVPVDSDKVFGKLAKDTEGVLQELVKRNILVEMELSFQNPKVELFFTLLKFASDHGAEYGKLSSMVMVGLTLDQYFNFIDDKDVQLRIRIPKQWSKDLEKLVTPYNPKYQPQ